MSLIRSLNSGVSGLRAYQTKMDVIGNNIANVETVGYKSSRVTFSEMMTQRLGRQGGGGNSAPQLSNEVGLGVRVASIDRDFSQGTLNSTGIATDLAIDGDGFFMVQVGNESLMTRAGNFVFNRDGYLVDQGGRFVQGYNADNQGNILKGAATDAIRIDFENSLPPRQTETVRLAGNLSADTSTFRVIQSQSALTTSAGFATEGDNLSDLNEITGLAVNDDIVIELIDNDGTTNHTFSFTYTGGETVGDLKSAFNSFLTTQNIDATLDLIDGLMVLRSTEMGANGLNISSITLDRGGTTIDTSIPAFQATQEGAFGTRTTSTTIYDNLGRAHTLILDFTQVGLNEWEWDARFLDGEVINTTSPAGTIQFDELGQLTTSDTLNINFSPGNGLGDTDFSITLGDPSSGSRFTQYAGSNSAKVVGQDGYAQGRLVDVAINGSGQIEGIYDNGNSQVLAQVAIATVQNELGLEMIGDGLFRATSAAGEVFVGDASDLPNTSISAGNLESSNVDLAREFTEMITSQRAYQSNARVITTSDEMLMEAVNLKR